MDFADFVAPQQTLKDPWFSHTICTTEPEISRRISRSILQRKTADFADKKRPDSASYLAKYFSHLGSHLGSILTRFCELIICQKLLKMAACQRDSSILTLNSGYDL